MAKQIIKEFRLYVGTYTHGKSKGIYIYRMDPSSGNLEYMGEIVGVENPSFLDIDPKKQYLYAVNELKESDGKPSGAVSAFSIDSKTGKLTYLNKQPSHGIDPCHLSVDKTGKFVLVANYGSGGLSVFPIGEGGRLGEATDVVQHKGSSINPKRQEGPHAHSIILDSSNRYAFAADLGLDKVMIYKFDSTKGKLKPNDQPWAAVKAGAGPRHFDFHPSGRYAFLINELDSTFTAFSYDGTKGELREVQTVSTLPKGFEGTSHCADVHVSPSGKYLYGSNRGHDSIATFAIDENTGKLILVGHEPTRGKTPRNFTIDPTESFLLAANQNTDTIATFRIDRGTGRLLPTGGVAEVPTPVCLKMIAI